MSRRLLAAFLAFALVDASVAHALGEAVIVVTESPGAVLVPPATPILTPALSLSRRGSAADQTRRRSLRAILRGTAVYKFGMDSMAVAIPLALNSATWIAVFMAVWNISQAISSSTSDGMFK